MLTNEPWAYAHVLAGVVVVADVNYEFCFFGQATSQLFEKLLTLRLSGTHRFHLRGPSLCFAIGKNRIGLSHPLCDR